MGASVNDQRHPKPIPARLSRYHNPDPLLEQIIIGRYIAFQGSEAAPIARIHVDAEPLLEAEIEPRSTGTSLAPTTPSSRST